MNESQRLFGIVQGRLTASPLDQLQRFPQEAWEEEFFSAANVGIEFIELLTERQYNSNNPVWSDEGRKKIKDLCVESKCSIYSICTDYIIDHSLIFDPDDSTYEHVNMFLHASGDLGCKIAVFPLLEESDLTPESSDLLVPLIKDFAATAAKYGITICIETLLNGENLIAFLEAVDEPNVKAVYDTGNRIIDTLDLDGEIRLLGNKIAHVHVKDKNIEHENVLLGTGRVNFMKVFQALGDINYTGPLVFETTRGADPLETVRYHIALCDFFTHEANYDQRA